MAARALSRAASRRALASATRPQLSYATARSATATAVVARRFNSTTSTLKPFTLPAGSLRAHNGARSTITHEIENLSSSLVGQPIVVAGWIEAARRANDKLSFIVLRSSAGSVQLVVRDPALATEMLSWPLESVIQIDGNVIERKAKGKSSSSPTDDIEVEVSRAVLLNPAESLPFLPTRTPLANEDLRAAHRYLDLRRPELANNLRTRSKVTHLIRCHLHDLGFTEVETPVLLNSSPEGAREFLVPTRVSSGAQPAFYALPQSPQQPKQLLVASGAVPRYFQLARCFRDEDGRKDRQPEFTQVDLEMAFVDGAAQPTAELPAPGSAPWLMGGGQVRDVIESLVQKIWKDVKGVDLQRPFRVMPYEIAMDVFGSDKPDTRFEMYTLPIGYYPTLSDASLDKVLVDENASTVEWMVTPAAIAEGLDVNAFATQTIDYVRITEKNQYSWLAESVLTLPLGLKLDSSLPGGVQPGDIVWLSRRPKIAEGGWTNLGRLRVQIMEDRVDKGLVTLPSEPHFLWVTGFPLFTKADEDKDFLSRGRWASTHHPFTAPVAEDLAELERGEVARVRGQHYDLVLDGQEIGGGSVRIHDAKLQEYVMREVLQLDDQEVDRFSHLLQALKCGAPPHGGIALGELFEF